MPNGDNPRALTDRARELIDCVPDVSLITDDRLEKSVASPRVERSRYTPREKSLVASYWGHCLAGALPIKHLARAIPCSSSKVHRIAKMLQLEPWESRSDHS